MSASGALPASQPVEVPRRALVLFDGPVDLIPGQEWHSDPIPLDDGDDLTLTCKSSARFYAGLFDRATHDRLRTGRSGSGRPAAPRAFPFRFNSDQVLFDKTYRIPVRTDYIAVVRRGVFSQGGPVQIRIVRTLR